MPDKIPLRLLTPYPPVEIPAHVPTWSDIEQLARDHPIVRIYVGLWRRGDLTPEQALCAMVFMLAKVHGQTFQQLIDLINVQTPTIFLTVQGKP